MIKELPPPLSPETRKTTSPSDLYVESLLSGDRHQIYFQQNISDEAQSPAGGDGVVL